MTRKFSLTAFAAAQCLIVGLAATAPARAAEIPQYFFSQWTVTANCTEAQRGTRGARAGRTSVQDRQPAGRRRHLHAPDASTPQGSNGPARGTA